MSTSIKEELQNVAKLPLGPRGQPASSSRITCPSSSWSKQYGKPYSCARSIACRRVAAERASWCAAEPHLAADVSHRVCVKPPDGSLGVGGYEPPESIQLHVLRRIRRRSRLRRVSQAIQVHYFHVTPTFHDDTESWYRRKQRAFLDETCIFNFSIWSEIFHDVALLSSSILHLIQK